MASHGCDIFSLNKRYEEHLQMEGERLRLLKVRAKNRILRQSSQLFEDLILLHVRTPHAFKRADEVERFEVGQVPTTMAFRPKKLPFRPLKERNCVTPTVELVGSDAYCTYNNQVHSRRKLPLDPKMRLLIERTRKISRSMENIRNVKESHSALSDPTSEQSAGNASDRHARPTTLADLPWIPQGGLLSLTAPKTARVRYVKPRKHPNLRAAGTAMMAGDIFGGLGRKSHHRTVVPGLPVAHTMHLLPADSLRRVHTAT